MQTLQLELPKEYLSDINFIKSELKDLKENFQPKEPKKYLSRSELAEMLGVDKSTIHNWRKRKIIEAVQIGGRIFFERESIENAIVKLKR
tara:strand:+ start:3449 stop:3718 length:270 start_codon:yes stop_codon:yes gene_type:complete